MTNAICEVYLTSYNNQALQLNDCPEDPASCDCLQYPGLLKANPDVGGFGVS